MAFLSRLRKLYYLLVVFILKNFSKIEISDKVIFQNFPFVKIHEKGKITIGKNTVINSSNYGYHINLFQKCKLYADRPGAKILIGANSRIHGTCIHAYSQIFIGDNCLIAGNCQIIDGNGHPTNFQNPENRIHLRDSGNKIEIGDNVWIAANCIILGGTKIGQGSIITAGSVVRGDVPENCIYGGNPAKLIRQN